ncbi:MAG: tetraacyldisaccharide 4'-kinase [Gammaproteobacteria bacterium]
MIWNKIWYENHLPGYFLAPVAWLYRLIIYLRKKAYRTGLLHINKLPVPVFIIGNISVGGTGKTPLVIWLIKFLKKQGYKPGVISRGYGGQSTQWPQQVLAESDPERVGDEPVIIARNAVCPVYVDPDRFAAGSMLLRDHDCDIIICDDGLQHYSLHRDFEICVVDGKRRHGNQRCLPAGPLREPLSRLESVDAIVCNGADYDGEFHMRFIPTAIQQITTGKIKQIEDFRSKKIHAVAGIGNPQRFFDTLRSHDLNIIEHVFPDHHLYTETDLDFQDEEIVIMTEKDAVKCYKLMEDRHWYLSIEASLPEIFERRLLNYLKDNSS